MLLRLLLLYFMFLMSLTKLPKNGQSLFTLDSPKLAKMRISPKESLSLNREVLSMTVGNDEVMATVNNKKSISRRYNHGHSD